MRGDKTRDIKTEPSFMYEQAQGLINYEGRSQDMTPKEICHTLGTDGQ